MKVKLQRIFIIIALLSYINSYFSIEVHAEDRFTSVEEVLQFYGPGTENENKKITKFLTDRDKYNYGYTKYIEIQGKNYWYREEDEDAILELGNEIILKETYNKNNADTLRRFNDATDNQTITPDKENTKYIMEGFADTISTVLGFIVVVISVGTTLSTAIDIGFIVLPLWRAELSGIKLLQAKDGSNKIRIVSDDAYYAVLKADKELGTNPLIYYFKSRIFTYLVLVVLLYILIDGKIVVLVQWALRIVGGIIDIIAQLG